MSVSLGASATLGAGGDRVVDACEVPEPRDAVLGLPRRGGDAITPPPHALLLLLGLGASASSAPTETHGLRPERACSAGSRARSHSRESGTVDRVRLAEAPASRAWCRPLLVLLRLPSQGVGEVMPLAVAEGGV